VIGVLIRRNRTPTHKDNVLKKVLAPLRLPNVLLPLSSSLLNVLIIVLAMDFVSTDHSVMLLKEKNKPMVNITVVTRARIELMFPGFVLVSEVTKGSIAQLSLVSISLQLLSLLELLQLSLSLF
jgi:hypothetical protein